jgi:hypothetical protein
MTKISIRRKTHILKTWPEYFQAIWTDDKTFEYRRNDRDYKEGDKLILQEYDPKTNKYSGREIECNAGYILYGGNFGLDASMCIISIGNCVHYDYSSDAANQDA